MKLIHNQRCISIPPDWVKLAHTGHLCSVSTCVVLQKTFQARQADLDLEMHVWEM